MEDMDASGLGGAYSVTDESLNPSDASGHLATPGPQQIIDLSESHSFIVTEVPPENVMEGDGEETEISVPAGTKT